MTSFRAIVFALLSGILFGGGLVIGGMTRPDKIVAFLDIFGNWDPSLAFVMMGAVGTYSVFYRLVLRRDNPIYSPAFSLPTRHQIDAPLVGGAALFGAGWGLGGYCPGPALTSVSALAPHTLVFVGAMLIGTLLNLGLRALRGRQGPVDASAKRLESSLRKPHEMLRWRRVCSRLPARSRADRIPRHGDRVGHHATAVHAARTGRRH